MTNQLREMINALDANVLKPRSDGMADGDVSKRAKAALDKLLASEEAESSSAGVAARGSKSKSKRQFGPRALMDILVRDGLCGVRDVTNHDAGMETAGGGSNDPYEAYLAVSCSFLTHISHTHSTQ